jgi:hypothetical protein
LDRENPHKRIIEKMVEAAMKEKFRQLAQKYNQKFVFDIWVEMAKKGGSKPYASKLTWKPELTIAQALDCLDNYCTSLEMQIRGKHSGEKS